MSTTIETYSDSDVVTKSQPRTGYEEQNTDAVRVYTDFEERTAQCHGCDSTTLHSMMYRHGNRGTVVIWECPNCRDWRTV